MKIDRFLVSDAAWEMIEGWNSKDLEVTYQNLDHLLRDPLDGHPVDEGKDDFSPSNPHSLKHVCKGKHVFIVFRHEGCDPGAPAGQLVVEKIKQFMF